MSVFDSHFIPNAWPNVPTCTTNQSKEMSESLDALHSFSIWLFPVCRCVKLTRIIPCTKILTPTKPPTHHSASVQAEAALCNCLQRQSPVPRKSPVFSHSPSWRLAFGFGIVVFFLLLIFFLRSSYPHGTQHRSIKRSLSQGDCVFIPISTLKTLSTPSSIHLYAFSVADAPEKVPGSDTGLQGH